MKKILIFGHKRPDTDTATSAIALSYLKNKLGYNTEARVLGTINKETEFVLNYFKVEEPKYLNDVKLQLSDLNYYKNYFLNYNQPIIEAYNYMLEKNITGVPLVNEDSKFEGLLTLKMIATDMLSGNANHLHTSYDNIIKTLQGKSILKFDDEINGDIIAASFRSTTIINETKLESNHILILGDRHSVIEYAILSKIKLLIVVGNMEVKPEHLELAKKNHVNIIQTPYDSFKTARLVSLSNYTKNIIADARITTFQDTDYYDDFIEQSSKLGYNNYPIVNKDNECLGLLRITDIRDKKRKQVILVDHNEENQSVDGLSEAEILEIVDHHKLGDLKTKQPINFRNMTVGSTNTIVYQLYQENDVEIPNNIAGLMISGILSDTLGFTSPTTTTLDKLVVEKLSQRLNLDYQDYAMKMFKAGSSLEGRTTSEIINDDLKLFPSNNKMIAVSQVFTLDADEILKDINTYVEAINELKNNKGYFLLIMCITDVIKKGSYIIYTDGAKTYLEEAFAVKDFQQGEYLEDVVSRKKQLIPNLFEVIGN